MDPKKLLVVFVVALFLAPLIILLPWEDDGVGRSAENAATERNAVHEAAELAPTDLAATTEPLDGTEARAAIAAPAEAAAAVEASTDASLCVVVGRVVDARGAPLAGASVGLGARVWHQDVETEPLPWPGGYDGFTTTTDAGGAFRFAVVPPQNATQRLMVEAGPFLSVHSQSFGLRTNEAHTALGAGTYDLGVIQLTDAGSISGRVVDVNGAPIAEAVVDVGPTSSTTYGRGSKSAADGSFVVTSVPPGACAVDARSERFRSASVGGLLVEIGRETRGVELVLENASTIEGVVRDTSGAPIVDARLTSWPNDEGRVAQARSREDGTFVLYLPQDGPHTLECKREGFATWGDQNDRTTLFESGARGIAIVMTALAPLAIRVVDRESGEPLTQFGAIVVPNMGSAAETRSFTSVRTSKIAEHPGGMLQIYATPGIDALDVSAVGYLTARHDIEAPTGPDFVQIVRLAPTGRIVGRALRDGVPIANAAVVLAEVMVEDSHAHARIVGEPTAGAVTWYAITPSADTRTTTRTDAEGRFAIEVTQDGDARLAIDAGPGATLQRIFSDLSSTATRDVGDLHADAPGRIEGTVITGLGVDPTGLVVEVDEGQDGLQALVDASGRFAIEGVPPGGHHVRLEGRRGTLATDPGRALAVASNATSTVEIDARSLTLGHLVLSVEATGFASESLDVLVKAVDGSATSNMFLPVTDGRVRCDVRAGLPLYASVLLPHGTLDLVDQPFTVEPLVTTEARVRIEFGAVEFVLPKDLALPASARFSVRTESTTNAGEVQNLSLPLTGGAPVPEPGADVRLDGLRLHVGQLLVGTWHLEVSVIDSSKPPELIDLGNGSFDVRQLRLHESTHTVTIEAGRASEVRLP